MSDDSSGDEDYDAYADPQHVSMKRFPIHDCCEFGDIEDLRRLILIPVEGDDEEDEGKKTSKPEQYSSSDDDNDSTAAAHAAAIGHSPQPIKNVIDNVEGMDGPTLALEPSGCDEKPAESGSADKDPLPAPPVPEPKTKENPETPSTDRKVEKTDDEAVPMEVEPTSNGNASAVEEKMDDSPSAPPEPATPKESPENVSPKPKKFIVNPEAELNERDEDENTPLHIAIHSRNLEHAKLLIEAGASYRMRSDGSLPLHTAISIGALREHQQFAYECVVLLTESGADLAAKDDSVHTPLYLACMFNLPEIVQYILSDDDGLVTLNQRADRAGNRALHAAAKYDTLDNPSFSKSAAASATGQVRVVPHHHPDGSVIKTVHPIPVFPGKMALQAAISTSDEVPAPVRPAEALLTQQLLGTSGIEVDALNMMSQTPLHVACARGNWPVVRLLLEQGANATLADRRGYTPGQLAYKRGMPIPNDLIETLGDPPASGVIGPVRDLIVDPNGSTLLISHELCMLHRTCPPMRRDSSEPPPENIGRLHVLVNPHTGILRSGEFSGMSWQDRARRAAMGDVLKCHEYAYVEKISQLAASIPDHPSAIRNLDPDTAISHWSFEAALRAAGSVCEAVDKVMSGEHRNAFCAVRPPGHHAGPSGIVRCAQDPEGGSHGFCLLNNVAIGAAYARCMYRNEGIQKVAIIDFDVHHGNGTEDIIRNLVPNTVKSSIQAPFAYGEISTNTYRPWLDETDVQNVFFSSTHGYGNRGYDVPGWFYPASGKSHVSEAIAHPSMVEHPNTADFILSQTWARMGEESKANCCKIINVGLELPTSDADPQSRSMKQRIELRDSYRKKILPHLREFDPDLIFISAGFDAHRKDTMNFGYVGMVEDDYEWVTEQLIKVANTCCNGRVISVLEGGYKIHGGIVSPFARSVASHVRAMVDGGHSRELYDVEEHNWESEYERVLFDKRERKKEQEREQLRAMEEANRRSILEQFPEDGVPEDPDAPSRKRRRNQVNYKELFKEMQQEGFAG